MMNDKRPVVALDIGNVCVSVDRKNFYSRLGVTPEYPAPPEFLRCCRDLEISKVNEDKWLESFISAASGRFSGDELKEIWNSIIGPNVPGMVEAVESFAEKFRFVYLSDTSRLHLEEVIRKNRFHHLISGGVYSFEAGCQKPDPGIYKLFEERYGVPCAYFDDLPQNIEGAAKRGWNAHIFKSAEQFSAVLNDLDSKL